MSHLDTPAALLTNQTEPVGRYLAVHLRGVDSNRDAIGAKVEVGDHLSRDIASRLATPPRLPREYR